MGNTKTLLPSRGGSPLLRGAGHSQVVPLDQTGGGPWPSTGHPLHSALSFFCLIFFFSTEEMLYLPPSTSACCPGGLALALLWMGVRDAPGCPRGRPLPQPGGFPGSLPITIPPSRLRECQWEQGPQGMMENVMAARGTAGIQQRWVA